MHKIIVNRIMMSVLSNHTIMYYLLILLNNTVLCNIVQSEWPCGQNYNRFKLFSA